jgi:lipopolysaccharide export LptBFGC system permease protein LptF
MRLLANNNISMEISAFIHVFSAPKFFLMAMPYAFFMANMVGFNELSRSSEIVALRSFGIGLRRIVSPSIALSLMVSIVMLFFQETIVVESNYKTATAIEKAVGIDRNYVEMNNLVYSQIHSTNEIKYLDLLLYSKKASNKWMKDVMLLNFKNGVLQKISTAGFASWKPKEKIWLFQEGVEYQINVVKKVVRNEYRFCIKRFDDALMEILTQTRDSNELNLIDIQTR